MSAALPCPLHGRGEAHVDVGGRRIPEADVDLGGGRAAEESGIARRDADHRDTAVVHADPGAAGRGREASRPYKTQGRNASSQAFLPAQVVGGHQLLCDLAGMGASILLPLTRTAAALAPHEPWFLHGYRTVNDFTRETLQRSARWLRDLERLHAALEALPALAAALTGADGGKPLGPKAVLCVASVATMENVASWIEQARRLSLPALRQAARECRRNEAAPGEATANRSASEPAVNHAQGEATGNEDQDGAAVSDHTNEVRVPVRLAVPPEVKLAFDAVKDLHAAVVGRDASPEALVEAMLGEAASNGWTSLDGFHARLRERFARTVRERQKGPTKERREETRDMAAGDPGISTDSVISMRSDRSTGSLSISPAMCKAQEALSASSRSIPSDVPDVTDRWGSLLFSTTTP